MYSISKVVIFLSLISSINGNFNTKLRELIVRVYGNSDSTTVYYIGSDKEFLAEFMKNQVSLPISSINADFTEDLKQCTNAIVVFQVPAKDNQSFSKLLQKVIKSLQVRKFAIISAKSLESLNQYFAMFAEWKFRRIFGIIGNTSSYAYLPYSENPVQELDENDHLPDALKNLNGFAFRTTIQADQPRTFEYPHKDGKNHIGGKAGQIFVEFLRRYNATFEQILIKTKDFFFDAVINATVNDEIDISMNLHYPHNNLDLSYPLAIEKNVIMVPCNGYLDPIEYFQRPFKATVWLCIGLIAIYMTISKIILNFLTDSKLDIWDSFCEIYLTLLSSSAGGKPPIAANYRFHLLVILFGFIFERLYGSHFQSFLTAYIKIRQYETIQDLVDNNVRVMISNDAWDKLKNDVYPKIFDKIIVPTDTVVFILQCISMSNTSFAYFLEADRCHFLIGYQSLYKKSSFSILQETINTYVLGYLLAFHSPFKEILDEFVIEIMQTGLIQKWDSDVLYHARATGFPMDVDADDFRNLEALHKPLTLHHLKLAWQFLLIGLTLSTVGFVFEWVRSVLEKSKLV